MRRSSWRERRSWERTSSPTSYCSHSKTSWLVIVSYLYLSLARLHHIYAYTHYTHIHTCSSISFSPIFKVESEQRQYRTDQCSVPQDALQGHTNLFTSQVTNLVQLFTIPLHHLYMLLLMQLLCCLYFSYCECSLCVHFYHKTLQ